MTYGVTSVISLFLSIVGLIYARKYRGFKIRPVLSGGCDEKCFSVHWSRGHYGIWKERIHFRSRFAIVCSRNHFNISEFAGQMADWLKGAEKSLEFNSSTDWYEKALLKWLSLDCGCIITISVWFLCLVRHVFSRIDHFYPYELEFRTFVTYQDDHS